MKKENDTAMSASSLPMGEGGGRGPKIIIATLHREGNDLIITFDGLSGKKVREAGHAFVVEGSAQSAHHWAHTSNVVRLQNFDFFTYGTGQELIDYCAELLAEYLPDETFEFNV